MIENSKNIKQHVVYGDTKDIITVVLSTYNNDYKQVKDFAQSVKSDNIRDTCNSIFKFIVANINYKEDPAGVQWVKSPARLYSDKSGDCKSMSIFTASCLRCLGIPHKFRFTSYNSRKDPTHVYVVAFDPAGNEIIIDPVVRVAGSPRFDYEQNFTHKYDMFGTNIYYLSGIETDADNIWFGNPSRAFDLTKQELDLYVNLSILDNLFQKNIKQFGENSLSASRILDRVDLALMSLYFYENYSGKPLKQYLSCVHALALSGEFTYSDINSNTINVTDRKLHFAKNKDFILSNAYKYELVPGVENWINSETGNEQYKDEIESLGWIYNPAISGINNLDEFGIWKDEIIPQLGGTAEDYATARSQIKNSIEYYACTLIPENELSQYPQSARNKREVHLKLLNNWNKAGFMTLEESAKIILSEIDRKYSVSGKGFINLIKTGQIKISGTPSIGFDPITITALVSAIASLVSIIAKLFGKSDTYFTPDNQIVRDNLPNINDFGGSLTSGYTPLTSSSGNGSLSSYLPYILIGGLALILLTGKK